MHRLLDIDVSTVYRMAADGRLPAVRIGRQWRFSAQRIEGMLAHDGAALARPSGTIPAIAAAELLELVAEPLGVMMVVTDLDGRQITPVANPCPWFACRAEDAEVVEACAVEWRALAADPNLAPRFEASSFGFLCARSMVRDGDALVGMVLAGGVAPAGVDDTGLYQLDDDQRRRVLEALPRVASLLSRLTAGTGPLLNPIPS